MLLHEVPTNTCWVPKSLPAKAADILEKVKRARTALHNRQPA